MNNLTKTGKFPAMIILLAVLLITAGMFSCNNSAPAEEKKEAMDTTPKLSIDSAGKTVIDSAKHAEDSVGKKGTVTPPPPPKN